MSARPHHSQVLAGVLLLGLLAGCGGSGSQVATSTTTPSSTPTQTPTETPTAGTTTSATRTTATADPDLVTVGGRSYYWHCGGTGPHLVVFEAGLTGDHRTWERVTAPLSNDVRFCVYDRANTGVSDPAPKPRTAKDVAADFQALLGNAGIDEPFVLVGFSFGGLFAQYYARTHPGTLAGLVLVEANHPAEDLQFYAHLTAEQITQDRQDADGNPEGIDIFGSLAETRNAAPLKALPLVVVTAGRQEPWPPGWDPKLFNRLRAEQQADLAAMVPGGRQVIARTSTHDIPAQEPDSIVRGIRLVLDQLA